MTVKAKIGVLVMALLEDDYNKTGHMRAAATAAAQEIADRLARYGEVVHAGLVEEEPQAAAAARKFNAEDVDIIVAMELAYTKGIVPARCLIDTTAPVLVWNAQRIARLGEDDGFDVVMLNSGMAGMPELTAMLLRTGRDFTMITSRLDDPEGLARVEATIKAAAVRRRLRTARVRAGRAPVRGDDRPHVRRSVAARRRGAGRLAAGAGEDRRPVRGDPTGGGGCCPRDRAREVHGGHGAGPVRAIGAHGARARVGGQGAPIRRVHRVRSGLADRPAGGHHPVLRHRTPVRAGHPASPEGDVNCAVAQLVMQELAGQSTTVENYVIDFEHNAVMFSHDGHGNPALATPGEAKVKSSIYYKGVNGFGAGFEFAYEPGPVTNLALVTMGENQWRFVISEGEFLPFPPRPDLRAPDTVPSRRAGIDAWCNAWCQAGATHHMAAARGHWADQLVAVARMLGIEAAVV